MPNAPTHDEIAAALTRFEEEGGQIRHLPPEPTPRRRSALPMLGFYEEFEDLETTDDGPKTQSTRGSYDNSFVSGDERQFFARRRLLASLEE